jgi:dihydrolipoamide dehydrogenase
MASVWSRLGAEMTVLEYMDKILPTMDHDISKHMQKILKDQGIAFQLGVKVTKAEAHPDGGCVVEIDGKEAMRPEKVLLAVGRTPNTEGLGWDILGSVCDARGRIPVDAHFSTTVHGVYAIGDVIEGPMLAHKAEEDGVACAEMLATGHGHVDYNIVPMVVYTDPEAAAVGKTEQQLKDSNIPFKSGVFPFMANGRARTYGDTSGFVKMIAHAETDRILGVHMVGKHAGDLIAEAAAAMAFHASSEDIARVCHAHPTLAEAVKEAAMAVDGRAIHG